MNNPKDNISNKFQTDTIQIDLRKWLFLLLSYWWLFALSLAIAIPSAYTYLRYTTYQYSARAVLLIKDAGRSGEISEQSILLAEDFTGGRKAMDNEIQILRSLPLMEKVIDTLGANVQYFRQGKIKERELYHESPILIDSFSLPLLKQSGVSFFIDIIDKKSFLLKRNEEDAGTSYEFSVPFLSVYGHYTISHVPNTSLIPGLYRIAISPIENIAKAYQSKVRVERVGDQRASSVLDLRLNDPVPKKAEDIINMLIDIYNQEEINDENQVLRNTIEFIDERVKTLTQELGAVERDIEKFKSSNAIITDNASSSLNFTLGEIRSSIQEVSSFEVKKNLLSSLESFLVENRETFQLIPANLFADNPVLSSLVNQYNSSLLQRDQLAITASPQNPTRIALEKQLMDLRELIIETIRNLQKDLQIPIDKAQKEIQDLELEMSTIPNIEKVLLEKKRTQTIKESLFLFLLQRREEAALSEAVTTASTRLLDRARSSKSPVTPKRKVILMAAFVLGLLIPILLIILYSLLETKVNSEEIVKSLVSIPILGRIGHNKGSEKIVVKAGDRSVVNEMFRSLRTNLNYLNLEGKKQVLLVTSSVSGEGKSFIAINLGIALSLSDKKVILIGLDLRKPKMASYLGVQKNAAGITNYLIGKSTLKDIITPFEGNPNLSYISSGPIPPNPAELILSDRMGQVIQELQKEYDYVLIDSPPIGLVSDALLLRKFVSNILIVVRHQFTRKIMLRNLEDMYQREELEKAHIILNGIKRSNNYYGYGGYHYGYGNGYGYYKND